ncbi:hypothetical protein Tco_0788471 [Tanacetum coccineum]
MTSNMEENRFCYITPRSRVKRLDYLHYTRKKGDGIYVYAAHADYYILLCSCARVAQLDVRTMHAAVLTFERRLDWLEKNIDHCLKDTPSYKAFELCHDDVIIQNVSSDDDMIQNDDDDDKLEKPPCFGDRGNEEFGLPDINNLVLSAVSSCGEGGAELNMWDDSLLRSDIQLPIGKLHGWVLKTVPNLPDCLVQFVHSRLYIAASQQDTKWYYQQASITNKPKPTMNSPLTTIPKLVIFLSRISVS